MKLYLGNSQDVVIDVDEIFVHPTGYSKGFTFNNKDKCAWLSVCWNGLDRNTAYFYYKTSKMRPTCFSEEEAEKLAKAHNVKNSSNTYNVKIKVHVSDITDLVMNKFRYMQPAIDYKEQPVPIDPYFVGMWLGDGTASSTSITNVDKAVIDYIYEHAKSIGMMVSVLNKGLTFNTINVKRGANPLMAKLRGLNLIKNKHIPAVYLENSAEVRLKVLAGLIDTDGYMDGHRYEIVQKNATLSDDIITLANSLGFFCRTVDKVGYATNTEKKTKRVYKRMNIFPGYNTPTIPVIIDYKALPENAIHQGVTINLIKTKTSHKHDWTDEMKNQFDATVIKYSSKNGRVSWKNMVENEELYNHLTTQTLRQVHGARKKQLKNQAAP